MTNAEGGSRPCTVSVCRGCCCGTRRKHPDIDHAWQLERLRAAAGDSAGVVSVRTTDCLDACAVSNVVVVSPSAEGRRGGGRNTWLGLVNDDARLEELITWISTGGPGVAPLPPVLELLVIDPPRRATGPASPKRGSLRTRR